MLPTDISSRCRWMRAAVVLLSLLAATGCAVVSKVARTARDLSPIDISGDAKRKRIGVMSFENRGGLPFAAFSPTADARMAAALSEACAGSLFVFPDDPGFPAFLRHPPLLVNGQIDNLALARTGRQSGFNAVVTGALIDIDAYREERGFLWFKDNESFVKLLVKLEVYDTRTGAKFVDRIAALEINAEEMESLPAAGRKDIGDPALIDAVGDLIFELGEEICDALEDRPWVGYVKAVEGSRAVLSSGSAQGIEQGDTFQVYDSTQTVSGAEGTRFFQIGPKSGQLTITAVTADQAEGEVVGHASPGCSVTLE